MIWENNAMAERILVVDCEAAAREIIVSMLSSANYECQEAGDGLEALALIGSGKEFELVLSSLIMPNLDGVGLLGHIKDKYSDIPFVIITTVQDISVALAAIRKGAYDYLLKPFEREQLLNTVRRALENRRLKLKKCDYQTNLKAVVQQSTEQLRQSLGNIETSHDNTLDALDLKEPSSEGHAKRVTFFTIAIARAMEIPKEEIAVIARGAFLHDIGKMAIPDEVLRKPGALTPDEFAIIKEHCLLGYKMLQKIPILQEASEIVYAHHERYDGTGYPRGLKGQEIPLGARIVAVANTVDSIMSDLPYRAARSLQAAREELQAWSGRQFDPEIVTVFRQIPDGLLEEFRRFSTEVQP
jgi:putative nucleotidyltransferase with HDIG domain